jgi:transposase
MIQVTPQMRVLVAVEPVDFRAGIDSIARQCRERLSVDPFSGTAYVFRNRRGTSIKILIFDGQGFWLCQKRLSTGRFRWWPTADGAQSTPLAVHQFQLLLYGGDPSAAKAAPVWRNVGPLG